MIETWKRHENYPKYLFSSAGNCIGPSGLPLKKRLKFGYCSWALSRKEVRAHRVIADLFCDRLPHHEEVNHKNGIKDDNRFENLEWVTKKENQQHSRDVLKKDFSHRRGSRSNFAKLSECDVLSIMKEISSGKKRGIVSSLDRKYGVTHGTISLIKSGRVWAHLKSRG